MSAHVWLCVDVSVFVHVCVYLCMHACWSVFLCVCVYVLMIEFVANELQQCLCLLMAPECLCVLLLLLNKQLIQSEALTWIDEAFCSWQLAIAIHLQPIFKTLFPSSFAFISPFFLPLSFVPSSLLTHFLCHADSSSLLSQSHSLKMINESLL